MPNPGALRVRRPGDARATRPRDAGTLPLRDIAAARRASGLGGPPGQVRATGLLVFVAACAVAASAVAACAVAASPSPGGTGTLPTPTPAGTTASPGASPSVVASLGPSASLPTQTDTAWGRIWDELPAGFPTYPGASPATVGRGPTSAELTVAADPAMVMSTLQTALEAAGYRTVSLSEPLEDGSRTLESAGSAVACRVQTIVGPLGGLTYIAVLFGAACPFQ